MSTIMKALKRLEKERGSERDRSLRDEVLASAPQPRSTAGRGISRMILGAALGVLASAALLGGWLFWGGEFGTRPVEITISEPLVPPPLSLAKTKPLPPVAESPAAQPATRQVPRETPHLPVVDVQQAPAPRAELAPVQADPIPSEPEPTRAEQEFLVDALLEEAIAAEAARRIEARQVSVEFSVRRTVWHPKAEQREAFIQIPPDERLQRVREGDVIGSAVVLSIEPAAVVLVRDGVETRKRVGAP